MAPTGFTRICTVKELLANGGALRVEAPRLREAIAVFCVPVDKNDSQTRRFYALADKCAHGRGSLSSGDIEEVGLCEDGMQPDGDKRGGLCVKCPRHRKKFSSGLVFNLENGRSFCEISSPFYTEDFQVASYSVIEENEELFVKEKEGAGIAKAMQTKVKKFKVKSALDRLFRRGKFSKKDTQQVQKMSGEKHDGFAEYTVIRNNQHGEGSNTVMIEIRTDKDGLAKRGKEKPLLHSSGPVWHVSVKAVLNDEGKSSVVLRDYTPVSSIADFNKGHIVLLVKVYNEGQMSKYLGQLRPGKSLLVSRDYLTLEYPLMEESNTEHGQGEMNDTSEAEVVQLIPRFSLEEVDDAFCTEAKFGMKQRVRGRIGLWTIAGGTGIAPVLQLLRHYLTVEDKQQDQVVLSYSSRDAADILMEKELMELKCNFGKRLFLFYHITAETHRRNLSEETSRSLSGLSFSRLSAISLLDCLESKESLLVSSPFIVISGPEAMNNNVAEAFMSLRVPRNRIKVLEA